MRNKCCILGVTFALLAASMGIGYELLKWRRLCTLRTILSENGLCTHTVRGPGVIPHSALFVPKNLKELHAENRVRVLEDLLGIVKTGKARDALAAGAFAIALEDSAVTARCMVMWSTERLDTRLSPELPTAREKLTERVERYLHTGDLQ